MSGCHRAPEPIKRDPGFDEYLISWVRSTIPGGRKRMIDEIREDG
jgi:hypothetical protein